MKFARVNINLLFRFHSDTTDEEVEMLLENIELPEGYEEGSFEITRIWEES